MSEDEKLTLLFLVASPAQRENLLAVASVLEPKATCVAAVLDAYTGCCGLRSSLAAYGDMSVSYSSESTGLNDGRQFVGLRLYEKPSAFLAYHKWLLRLVTQCRPSAMVLGSDLGLWERHAVALARKNGIPVALMQDGLLSGPRPATASRRVRDRIRGAVVRLGGWILEGLGVLAPGGTRFAQSGCDMVLVSGEAYRILLLSEGVVAPIFVTGMPRMDALRPFAPAQGATVLVVDHLYGHYEPWRVQEDIDFYTRVVTEALESGAERVVIRPHPMDERSWYESLLASMEEGMASRVILDGETSISESLKRSRVVVSRGSTAVLEALLRSRPVVIVDVDDAVPVSSIPDYVDIEHSALVRRVSALDIGSAIDECAHAHAPVNLQFLGNYVGPGDGQASVRVASLLEQIAR